MHSAQVTLDIEDININNIDKNKLKYIIKIRNKTKGGKFKQIYEGTKKDILIENLSVNSDYEILIYSSYEFLISPVICKSFNSFYIDSDILAKSGKVDELLEKIYKWLKFSKLDLLYRGTRDGASSKIFHENVMIKVQLYVYIKMILGTFLEVMLQFLGKKTMVLNLLKIVLYSL